MFRSSLLIRDRFVIAALFALASSGSAQAQWRVVGHSSSAQIAVPQLPVAAAGHAISAAQLAPSGMLSLLLTQSNGRDGYWIERNNGLLASAELDVVGASGPGRGGAEAGHVFRQLLSPPDAARSGDHVFIARAGTPGASPNNTLDGVWLANGNANVEIARFGSEGVLGPNLGSGWTYSGNVPFETAHIAQPGTAILYANVRTSDSNSRSAITRHQAGVNGTCAMAFDSRPAFAPGVFAADLFESISQPGSSRRGAIYARGTARTDPAGGGFRIGLWRLCNGAPAALAVTLETGPRGPGLELGTEVFEQFADRVAPIDQGVLFAATGRESITNGTPAFDGVFLHDNGSVRPILIDNRVGNFGPAISGMVFSSSVLRRVESTGRWALVQTNVRPQAGGSSQAGVWRLSAERGVEPLALVGGSGALVPEAGSQWVSFERTAISANGETIVLANTSLRGLGVWRLHPSQPPARVLSIGDSIEVPTSAGLAQAQVTAIGVTGTASAEDYAGDDGWLSDDGRAAVRVSVSGYSASSIWARGIASDRIFVDGFD